MSKSTPKPGAKTLDDWRASHDRRTVVLTRLQAAIDKMNAEYGPEHWEYEADFIKLADVNQNDCSKYRGELAAFTAISKPIGARRSRSDKIAWFATKNAAAEARGDKKPEKKP